MRCQDCGALLGTATGVCVACGADPFGYYDDVDACNCYVVSGQHMPTCPRFGCVEACGR